MGCRYPKVNISLQENPGKIISYQIQFEITKKEPITKKIKKFVNFVSSQYSQSRKRSGMGRYIN